MNWHRTWVLWLCSALVTALVYIGIGKPAHAVGVPADVWPGSAVNSTVVRMDGTETSARPTEDLVRFSDRRLAGRESVLTTAWQVDPVLRVHPTADHENRLQRVAYRVRPGDTLWDIAVRFQTSVARLMADNHLTQTVIYPGERLAVLRSPVQSATPPQNTVHLEVISAGVRTPLGIPKQLIPVYKAAGAKYGIPWTVLAAIHKNETNFATGPIVSSAGAEGPMQFMPSTFARFGVTAPGRHGRPDINNVYDAIYSAAHLLAAEGYAEHPWAALYMYNHSAAYVQQVENWAERYAL
ncbi:MAG: LysM peptidoglycan-binding domain-containing protein [Alicyclobacillus sp.]|nr:LysM peptidoglycan-binding domain-containing protein [Alicyclobacillus sp.]